MGSLIAALLSAESAAIFAFAVALVLVYLVTKVHLESKQNAREHAELKAAYDRQAEITARHREETARHREETVRHREETVRQGEKIDRQGEDAARHREETARHREETARQGEATDRRFDSTDRKLDQLLSHLLRNRSDNDG